MKKIIYALTAAAICCMSLAACDKVATDDANDGVEPGIMLYFNNFDNQVATETYDHGKRHSKWPYLSDFEGWINHEGPASASVEYEFEHISARANETSNGEHSNYKGSGKNNIFFSSAPNYFIIKNIDTPARNIRMTFGVQTYSQAASNEYLHTDFIIKISGDGGATWSQIVEYEFDMEDEPGQWRLAHADFTLPKGTENIAIRFEDKVGSKKRLDDLKIETGNGGQIITFGDESTIALSKISDVLAGPLDKYYKIEGQIIATHTKGFLVKDDTDVIMVFKKKHGQKTGNKVQIEGGTTEHANMKQFGENSTITVLDENSTYTQPEPEAMDAAKLTEYAKNPDIRYVSYTGAYNSWRDDYYQWHNEVVIENNENLLGNIQFADSNQFNLKMEKGTQVNVCGYLIGAYTTAEGKTLISTMITKFEPVEATIE